MIVKDTYLQHILMFVSWYAELVFPTVGIDGRTGVILLPAFATAICFRTVQVKYEEHICFCPD